MSESICNRSRVRGASAMLFMKQDTRGERGLACPGTAASHLLATSGNQQLDQERSLTPVAARNQHSGSWAAFVSVAVIIARFDATG